MQKSTGFISQSQDAKRTCALVKQLGGANACLQPCAEAMALKSGGKGIVDRYSGLTEASVACYNNVMSTIRDVDQGSDECRLNHALECLQNASALPSVNEAIVRERRSACKAFSTSYPNVPCSACHDGRPRVDYERSKQRDVIGVDVVPLK
ncbi:hypothetical protein Q4S45_08270 [Massilia sp. R2A-15]|uniref:hypothetical protein n=1 Tax=Massilia sp. R2A-15 TaxID=3064278 RepID=UPI0027376038|nr:hypothetical protein [Massilia sp. R2A-15]WLI91100.1 hypothetical protein Q4S45_08270 [Massilia sp. R2A-15]